MRKVWKFCVVVVASEFAYHSNASDEDSARHGPAFTEPASKILDHRFNIQPPSIYRRYWVATSIEAFAKLTEFPAFQTNTKLHAGNTPS